MKLKLKQWETSFINRSKDELINKVDITGRSQKDMQAERLEKHDVSQET